MPDWRILEFALLSGLVLAVALAAATALLQYPIQRLLTASAPARRARLATWVLVGPLIAGVLYALATVAVSASTRATASLDASCSTHQGRWLHACVWHPLDRDASPWSWLALALLLLAVAGLVLRALRVLLRARRHLGALLRLGRAERRHGDIHVLDTDAPVALACGVGCGHVLLSRPLVDALAPEQLRVVVAHERAHLAHRDGHRRLVARLASGLHFPAARRRWLAALDLATEQRCDRIAADAVGSRLLVAETLLAVERLCRGRPRAPLPALARGFATDFLRERVEALLTPQPERDLPAGIVLLVATLAFGAASTGWVHHVAEFLVTLLAG